ncbi:MAG: YiiX/YebB-like N1pC/P60 family cysteine hydrolase [Polyangiales bacterium]
MAGGRKRRERGIGERILTVFGDLKVFPHPMFLVYDPKSYAVRAEEIRFLLDCIEPGDILVRGYRNYLDGYFIPGYFTHVGLYVGDIDEADRDVVENEEGLGAFRPGPQRVVHAMAEGVFMEDLLQFVRCDSLCVLRLPEWVEGRAATGPLARGRRGSAEPAFDSDEEAIFEALSTGGKVHRSRIVPVLRRRALSRLGTDYDFDFDFADSRTLSCTELVHFAMRCLAPFHGLAPEPRTVLGLLTRTILEPDRFLQVPGLERVMATRAIPRDIRRAYDLP